MSPTWRSLKDSDREAIKASRGNCGCLQLLMGFPLSMIPVVDFRRLSVRNGCTVWFYLEPWRRSDKSHYPECGPGAPCWLPGTEPPGRAEGSAPDSLKTSCGGFVLLTHLLMVVVSPVLTSQGKVGARVSQSWSRIRNFYVGFPWRLRQ